MTVRLTYLGHSTFQVDADGTKLIIDPFLSPNNPSATVTAEEVEADYILVSHGHGDHISDAAKIANSTGAIAIANVEIAGWLQEQGANVCHGMNIGGAYSFPFGRVKLTIAHHSSGLPDGSYGGNPVGFLMHFNDGHDVYFAGDTSLTYDMKLIGEAGGVDLALLPIGDYYTMGPDEAVQAAQFVKSKHVIPIHYNTFPEIEQDAEAFANTLRLVAEIDCTVLSPNETFTLE
jgi:L-ascorbate metabolism protein UlaG (beta-lactamase superfamily)